jgi:hypothetical protein
MKKQVIADFTWGIGIVILALGATWARNLGYVDADTVTRLVLGATGLMVAWFGNRIPKTIAPSARARKAQRVAGWSMALSGLVYAGLWAFAPMEVAMIGGCGAVLLGIAVTFAYCRSLRGGARTA